MTTFVIADLHLAHKKVITFQDYVTGERIRPFDTIEEMHDAIVAGWNRVVEKHDTVWVLGDIAFKRDSLDVLDRLKGKKKAILGNHDLYNIEYHRYFTKVYGCIVMTVCGVTVLLSHMPVHQTQLDTKRYALNVHGHLHSAVVDDPRYINCSVEQCFNYEPMALEAIVSARLEQICQTTFVKAAS